MNQLGGLMSYGSMNPDSYAASFANKNGISFDEAKNQLRSQYGDPMQGMQNCSIFMSNPIQEQAEINFDDLDMSQYASGNSNNMNFFQRIANFFKGNEGPQKEGDPQPHLNMQSNMGQYDMSMSQGPQKEGDPQPHLNMQSNMGQYDMSMSQGPQKEGDPQPHLGSTQGVYAQNPFGGQKQDPDEFAAQYAAQNNITLEQAKVELQEMYGDPTQA